MGRHRVGEGNRGTALHDGVDATHRIVDRGRIEDATPDQLHVETVEVP